jgi:hypothetical protein
MKPLHTEHRQSKTQSSSRVNPWMSASAHSFGYQSSSSISLVKNGNIQHRKQLSDSSASVVINDPSSEVPQK